MHWRPSGVTSPIWNPTAPMADRSSIDPRLVDLLYDDLEPDAAVALRAEIDADPELRAQWDDLERIHAGLGPPRTATPPAGLRDAILAAAREAEAPGTASRGRSLWGPAVFLAAAAVALMLLLPRLLVQPRPGPADLALAPAEEVAHAPPSPVSETMAQADPLAREAATEEPRPRPGEPGAPAALRGAGQVPPGDAMALGESSEPDPGTALPPPVAAPSAPLPDAREPAVAMRSSVDGRASTGPERVASAVPDPAATRARAASATPPIAADEAPSRPSAARRSAPAADAPPPAVASAPRAAPPAPGTRGAAEEAAEGADLMAAAPAPPARSETAMPLGAVGAGRGAGAAGASVGSRDSEATRPQRSRDHLAEHEVAEAAPIAESTAVRAERTSRQEPSRLDRRIAALDRHDPGRPRLMLRAAGVAERRGDTAEAMRWLDRLLAEHPESREAEEARGMRERLRRGPPP